MSDARSAHRCATEESSALAHALGDTPGTVFAAQLLRRGLCQAYLIGPPDRPDAVLVEPFPGAFLGFGDDARALWDLIQRIPEWTRVGVDSRLASELGEHLRRAGRETHAQEVIFSTLATPVRRFVHSDVRLLGVDDSDLLTTSPGGSVGRAYGSTRGLLHEGVVAAAIQHVQCIARAHTSCHSARYADVAIATREEYRGRGWGTAAASLVCARVQSQGRTPIWSTTIDNHASRRIAEKLGFVDTSHMTYFSLDQP